MVHAEYSICILSKNENLKTLFSSLLLEIPISINPTAPAQAPLALLVDSDLMDSKEAYEKKQQYPSAKVVVLLPLPYLFSKVLTHLEKNHAHLALPEDITPEEAAGLCQKLMAREEEKAFQIPKELITRYEQNLVEKLTNISQLFERLVENPDDAQVVKELKQEVHKIAGSGASYGYKELGDICRKADLFLSVGFEERGSSLGSLSFLSQTLRQIILAWQKIPLKEQTGDEKAPSLLQKGPEKTQLPASCDLYLVSPDPLVQKLLAKIAADNHFKLIGELNPHHGLQKIKSEDFSYKCLILEGTYPQFRLTVQEFLSQIGDAPPSQIGVILAEEDLDTQMELKEKGVSFTLRKPLDQRQTDAFLRRIFDSTFAKQLKALILDDDPDACFPLLQALEKLNVKTEAIHSEEKLLQTLKAFNPELLFLDLGLTKYGGMDLLEILRKDSHFDQLTIVIYTASESSLSLKKCAELGADGYIIKPLDARTINFKLPSLIVKASHKFHTSQDSESGALTHEAFLRAVESFLSRAKEDANFSLVGIEIVDLATLVLSSGEDAVCTVIHGIHTEINLHFQNPLFTGRKSHNQLFFLIKEDRSGVLEFQFREMKKHFIEDVQVFTDIQTPLLIIGAAIIFKKDQATSFPQLIDKLESSLKEAQTKGETSFTTIHHDASTHLKQIEASIVIIDDDPDLTVLLEANFRSAGLACRIFNTGQEGIDYFYSLSYLNNPIVLLLDRMLPDMDGMNVLRAIRLKFSKEVRVIFLSSIGNEKDLIRGLQEGAIDYVTKPFNMNFLIEKVKLLLAL